MPKCPKSFLPTRKHDGILKNEQKMKKKDNKIKYMISLLFKLVIGSYHLRNHIFGNVKKVSKISVAKHLSADKTDGKMPKAKPNWNKAHFFR